MAEKAESSAAKEPLHPIFLVTNIEKKVRFILDNDKVQYDHWATFFRLQTNAYHVSDHIDAPPTSVQRDDLWKSIDSIILSWIYQTISDDLVLAILTPDQTARQAWVKLENMFHDNKGARVAELEIDFVSLRLEHCSSLDDYCNKLKSPADQIGNVGTAVGNERLVIQLTNGLTPAYGSVAMLIQQTAPLPNFLSAVSMLRLEERRLARQEAAAGSQHVLMTTSRSAHTAPPPPPPTNGRKNGGKKSQGGRKNGGKHVKQGRDQDNSTVPLPPPTAQPGSWVWCPAAPSAAPPPPCPYPTAPGWAPPASRQTGSGLLGHSPGSRPHALTATSGTHATATVLGLEFSGMTLNVPDQTWYMDSGATSHLTSQKGSDMLRDYKERLNITHENLAGIILCLKPFSLECSRPVVIPGKLSFLLQNMTLKQIKHGQWILRIVYEVDSSEFPKQSGGYAQVLSARLEFGEEHRCDKECMMGDNWREELKMFLKAEGLICYSTYISLKRMGTGTKTHYKSTIEKETDTWLDFRKRDVEHVLDYGDDEHVLNMACTTLEEPFNLAQCASEQHWDEQVPRATVVEHSEFKRNETLEAVDASKSQNGIAFSEKQDMRKTLKGNSRIHKTYSSPDSKAVCTWDSEFAIAPSGKQDPTAIKHDETGKTMNSLQSTNAVAFSKRKALERRCGISGRIVDLDVLKQHFYMKLEDAAASLGVSRSTLKRTCRQYNISRWPSNKQCRLFDLDEFEKDVAYGTISADNLIPYPNAAGPSEQQRGNRMLTCEAKEGDHVTVSNNHVRREDTSILPDSTKGYNIKTVSRKRKFTDTGLERARGDRPCEIFHVNPGPSARNVTIKAVYGEDIIRFDFCSSTSRIFKLKEEVAKRLILDTDSFDIKYLDNDNDWILMRCEEDLKQCIDICSQQDSNVIRLQIRKTL